MGRILEQGGVISKGVGVNNVGGGVGEVNFWKGGGVGGNGEFPGGVSFIFYFLSSFGVVRLSLKKL